MPKKIVLLAFQWAAYALATVQVLRFYVGSTSPGISFEGYLAGTARLPYQKRYLAAILLRGMLRIPFLVRFLEKHHAVLSPPLQGCFLILSGVSLVIAGVLCVKLYKTITVHHSLIFLVYPLFLVLVVTSFCINVEQNLHLPYDFLSLAFFTAGIYCIYTRRFLWLMAVMLAGTLNRETTLFLIPIYLLDAASRAHTQPGDAERTRFTLAGVSLWRALTLLLCWSAVELQVSRMFANNGRQEVLFRLKENLQHLYPEAWPAVFNMCGYLLPFVFLFRNRIVPARFGNYAWVAVPWVAVMFCEAVTYETRIYGELVPYVTVASVLLIEQHVFERAAPKPKSLLTEAE